MTQTTIPDLNIKAVNENSLFSNPWQIYLQAIFKAIRAKFSLNLRGILSTVTTSSSNSGGVATDLNSYLLNANTLINDGDIITIEAWGTFAANANNKTLSLQFGSQVILTTGSVAANSGSWKIEASIVRTSPATQEIIATIISSNSSITDSATRTAGTQDLKTNLTIKLTGQGVSSNDLTNNALIIGLTPND